MTTQLDTKVIQQLNELQARRTTLINTFGQIYVRRTEIDKELEKLFELETEATTSYTRVGQDIEDILAELRKEHPQGVIDLTSGTIEY
jgi:uncharacterized coiled-coil DUF342 family protein